MAFGARTTLCSDKPANPAAVANQDALRTALVRLAGTTPGSLPNESWARQRHAQLRSQSERKGAARLAHLTSGQSTCPSPDEERYTKSPTMLAPVVLL